MTFQPISAFATRARTTMPVELDDAYAHVNPTYVSAYQICRRVEKDIIGKIDSCLAAAQKAILEKQLVYIRILGHLFSVGLLDTAKTHVAKSIVSCTDEESLIKLGMFYEQHFIRSCKLFYLYASPSTDLICQFVATRVKRLPPPTSPARPSTPSKK